jgi:hypothetical protein
VGLSGLKYEKLCLQLSTSFKRHVGFWSKRAFKLCWGKLEGLKSGKKISKIGLSWMNEPLDFSFWQRKKLLQWYIIYLFSSALPILLHSPFISFLIFFFFCLLVLSFASLIRISEGLLYSKARGSAAGWGTMLKAGRYRVRVPMRLIFFNWPDPSGGTMALGSTQPLTEMSARNLPGDNRRLARKADKLNAICGPIL